MIKNLTNFFHFFWSFFFSKQFQNLWVQFLNYFDNNKNLNLSQQELECSLSIYNFSSNVLDIKTYSRENNRSVCDWKIQVISEKFSRVESHFFDRFINFSTVEIIHIDESQFQTLSQKKINSIQLTAMNLAFQFTIEKGIFIIRNHSSKNADNLISKEPQAKIRPNSPENEFQSYQWLKTTMMTYKNSLETLIDHADLVLEFKLSFSKGNDEHWIFLFQSYNLFWQIKFLPHGMLRVSLYDDKDGTESKSNVPKMQGDFYHYQNQIWDEVITVFEKISNVYCRLNSI